MKIIVDADASPVLNIVIELAKKYQVDLLIVSDYNHLIQSDYGEIKSVDKGQDQADHEIMSQTNSGDLVVTQDYGLASLVLLKNADVLHQNGWFYTQNNIDQLLMQRQISQKMRRASKRYTHIPKRKKEDDDHFRMALENWINKRQSKSND
jgi:hypothetical protein